MVIDDGGCVPCPGGEKSVLIEEEEKEDKFEVIETQEEGETQQVREVSSLRTTLFASAVCCADCFRRKPTKLLTSPRKFLTHLTRSFSCDSLRVVADSFGTKCSLCEKPTLVLRVKEIRDEETILVCSSC